MRQLSVREGMARGWRIWTALWIVYIVWGSTYLAIKVSVETMPPLLSAGLRFVLAGLLLAAILALRRTSLRVRLAGAAAAVGLGVAAARLRRRRRHARRDADRLERRGDDRRLGAAAGDHLAHDRARATSRRRRSSAPSSASAGSR